MSYSFTDPWLPYWYPEFKTWYAPNSLSKTANSLRLWEIEIYEVKINVKKAYKDLIENWWWEDPFYYPNFQ